MAQYRDNLSCDAADARAAGMQYGKWKAEHPFTQFSNEHRYGGAKPKTEVKQRKEIACKNCGKLFVQRHSQMVYCGDDCRYKYNHLVEKARKASYGGHGNG